MQINHFAVLVIMSIVPWQYAVAQEPLTELSIHPKEIFIPKGDPEKPKFRLEHPYASEFLVIVNRAKVPELSSGWMGFKLNYGQNRVYTTSFSCRAQDGDILALFSQAYQWNGKRRVLERFDAKDLPPLKFDPPYVYSINAEGSFYFNQSLNIERTKEIRVRKEPNEKNSADLKLRRFEDKLPVLPVALKGKTSGEVQMFVGDHIAAEDWDFEIVRIVPPDKERKIQGWVDIVRRAPLPKKP